MTTILSKAKKQVARRTYFDVSEDLQIPRFARDDGSTAGDDGSTAGDDGSAAGDDGSACVEHPPGLANEDFDHIPNSDFRLPTS